MYVDKYKLYILVVGTLIKSLFKVKAWYYVRRGYPLMSHAFAIEEVSTFA